MPVELRRADPVTGSSTDPAGAVQEDVGTSGPWCTVVWNDPVNLMSYVVFVLRRHFGYSRLVAEQLMMQVHEEGRAVVANGPREQCELHVFRLHEHGLWATMQHDE